MYSQTLHKVLKNHIKLKVLNRNNRYKKWEFYLGGENLTNYRQENPIIEPENPFGSKFDATRAWGPVIGYNLYFGIRFAIPQQSN